MGLSSKILVFVCFAAVFVLSMLSLDLRAKRFRRRWKDPFCEARQRPAGESLRLRLLELDEKLMTLCMWYAVAFAISCSLFSDISSPLFHLPYARMAWAASLSLCTLVILGVTIKLWRLQSRYRALRIGFDGERYVGQLLTDRLLPLGCRVFHDLPFDGFNVDHLVLCHAGVFVVETKTYSKPTDAKSGKAEYRMKYDGRRLYLPRRVKGNNELGQTEFIAKKVAEWLSGEMGETVPVQPVLLFPGWFVEKTGNGPVIVTSPNYLEPCLFPGGVPSLNAGRDMEKALYNRILYLVTKRATIEAEK